MRKLRTDGRPFDVDARLPVLRELLGATDGLVAGYLFGSYGTPHQTPLSDVDVALVFRKGAVPSLDDELRLRGEILQALREEDVSIVILNRAQSPFQHRVLSEGRLLYCRDETALADFVEDVLRTYLDFSIDYRHFLQEYDQALRERYAHG